MKHSNAKMKDNNCNLEGKDSKGMDRVDSNQNHEDAHDGLDDMPEWTEEMFKKARVGHYYIPPELKDQLKKFNN